MLVTIAEEIRRVLAPFLIGGSALLLLLLALLIAQRLIRAAAGAHHARLARRYGPLVDAALQSDSLDALHAIAAVPSRHRAIVGGLVLAQLRVLRGDLTARAAEVAERLALGPAWRADLGSSRWWRRSEAALALGLVRDRQSVPALIALLDDEEDQVRAAAIDALGQIGDAAAIPALLSRMGDPTRHERTRVVEALRAFGASATSALVEHGESHPVERGLVASIIAFVGGASAATHLIGWAATDDEAIRAAVWRALATIGLDERAFYHALKALHDDSPEVRAAAARALARSGRTDASRHLARTLDDVWEVAAHSARALAGFGPVGLAVLHERVKGEPGLGQDLAQQVLWESGER